MECTLHNNQRLWTRDDVIPRQIVHGDYISLQIRGDQSTTTVGLQVELCEQESADSQRYLYQQSPQRSPTSPSQEEESSETGTANGTVRTDRSRSPYRTDDGHDEGSVLLQLKAARRQSGHRSRRLQKAFTIGAVVASTLIQPVAAASWWHEDILWRVQPHVTDRWCVADAQDGSRTNLACYDGLHQTLVQARGGHTHQSMGCRHDLVRRPLGLSDASLGGSYDGEDTLTLYTRSHCDISRQSLWFSGTPPIRDVDAILARLRIDVSRTLTFAQMQDKIAISRQHWQYDIQHTQVDLASLMQRPAHSPPPTRVYMRLIGLRGYSDMRRIDTTLTLSSQVVHFGSQLIPRRSQLRLSQIWQTDESQPHVSDRWCAGSPRPADTAESRCFAIQIMMSKKPLGPNGPVQMGRALPLESLGADKNFFVVLARLKRRCLVEPATDWDTLPCP